MNTLEVHRSLSKSSFIFEFSTGCASDVAGELPVGTGPTRPGPVPSLSTAGVDKPGSGLSNVSFLESAKARENEPQE